MTTSTRPSPAPKPAPTYEQITGLVDATDDGDLLAELLLDAVKTLEDITSRTRREQDRPSPPSKVARRALERILHRLEDQPPVTRENT